MNFSTGLWDRFFGKKTTLEIPDQDGAIINRVVSIKWLSEMIRQGKITPVDNIILTHILDPLAKDGYVAEHWTIGEDVSQDSVDKFINTKTKELYAMVVYKNGEGSTYLLKKEKFDEVLNAYEY